MSVSLSAVDYVLVMAGPDVTFLYYSLLPSLKHNRLIWRINHTDYIAAAAEFSPAVDRL
jgi:hypothetical protein